MPQLTAVYRLAARCLAAITHGQVLGLTLRSAGTDGIELELPFQDGLVGYPGIHSGAVTTLLDTCCGLSVLTVLPEPELCPTLDLRLDFLRRPEPARPVRAFAEAYHLGEAVVFTRGVAFHDCRHSPLAHVVATFMRTGKKLQWSLENGSLEDSHGQ